MATRRPKVPRATPAAPKSTDTDDGGDVIQADFGGPRGAAAGTSAAARPAPGGPATGAHGPDTGTAATGAHGPDTGTVATGGGPASPGRKSTGKAASGNSASGKAASGKAGTGEPEESLDPVPAKAFSGRLLALGVVMIAITIMLAPTVKIFLDKRAEIAGLQADIAAKQSQQNDLKRQVSRWQDPNYVKQQARDRINMVMPGETGYWVFGSDLPAAQSGGAAGAASAQHPANLPWVDALWESIRRSATD
ncbi:FtsB family cell division protein [Pseudarthrobacter sp. S9]|uniref:FtsB family cell division protein n=1 Tax=Pseudarthrobacter sp. S9 TaxID=3418421 RepID=UPI003D02BBD2